VDEVEFQSLLNYIEANFEKKDEHEVIISLSSSAGSLYSLDNTRLNSDQLGKLASKFKDHNNQYIADISMRFNEIDDKLAVHLINCIVDSIKGSFLLLDLSDNPISLNAKKFINYRLTHNSKGNYAPIHDYPASKIKLYYWPKSPIYEKIKNSSNVSHTGHVSLEVFTESGRYIYVSYYPKSRANCLTMWKTEARFQSKRFELSALDDYQEIELDDIKLDLEKIVDKFFKNYKKWKNGTWSIAKNHCATRAVELLSEGGLLENFPAIDKFGSIRYLSLLCSSRIFIAIALLGHGLYPLLGNNYPKYNIFQNLFPTITLVLLNGIIVFFLEKTFEHNQLIESNNFDCLVGLAASFGFGFTTILHRRYISPSIDHYSTVEKILVDMSLLLTAPTVMIIFGRITSLIIDLCGGKGYTVTPNNMANWIRDVNENKKIDVNIRRYIFLNNLSFFIILYSGGLASYAAKKLFFSGEDEYAMILGIICGAIIGYVITKILIHFLEKKYLNKLNENNLKFLQRHHRSPEKHAILLVTTLLGILGAVSFCNSVAVSIEIMIANPYLESFLSPAGGALGFILGHYIHLFFQKFCKNHITDISYDKLKGMDDSKIRSDDLLALSERKVGEETSLVCRSKKQGVKGLEYGSMFKKDKDAEPKRYPILLEKKRSSPCSCSLL
jgi:hypothetical protein